MKERYIRNGQPHIQPVGATYSVTILVHDAIPAPLLEAARQQREEELSRIISEPSDKEASRRANCHARYFDKIEQLLHAKTEQSHPFRDSQVATMALDYIRELDGRLFHLNAACVMSNHIHFLVDLSVQVPAEWDGMSELENYVPLASVVGRIKGGISRQYHKYVGDNRPLWARGYYDRCIRSLQHYHNEQNYIINNPVKAGIVSCWQDYAFSYLPPLG